MTDVDTTISEPLLPVGNGVVPDLDATPTVAPDDGPQPDLVVTYNGQEVPVFINRLTGSDWHLIRGATGMSVTDGLRSGSLDIIAAITWRVLARSNAKLQYKDVAARITLEDVS